MKLLVISILVLVLNVGHLVGQCTNGILMTSCGGCQSGCDLTSFGGPNCAALGNPTGNCSSVQNLSTDIVVPAGCSFTVTATMTSRPGCNNGSGADNGDRVKVDIVGGPKPFVNGASNGTISDSYTLVGPGIIRVSAQANRRDEITTYTVSSTGANGGLCPDCISSLPIELISFDANIIDRSVELVWKTNAELNNDYFTIERSIDGLNFEFFEQIDGAGNTSSKMIYTLFDVDPFQGLSYYRLKQTDVDGSTKIVGIEAVNFSSDSELNIFPNPANTMFYAVGQEIEEMEFELYNSVGQLINVKPMFSANMVVFDASTLPRGHYLLKSVNENKVSIERIVLN